MRYALSFSLLVAVLLTAAGCKRTLRSETKTETVDANKVKIIDLEPATQMEIEVSAKDGMQFSAYLVTKEDADKVAADADSLLKVKHLAKLESVSRGKLVTPKTDKKTAWCVLLGSRKPATVTLKITGE